MWRIENPELRRHTLDFTSSEQGLRKFTQLLVDGVELSNALELLEWRNGETQFLICSGCGIEGCKRGDWVRVRRSDSLILLLPAFDYVWAERDYDQTEYFPPSYLTQRGVAYFDRPTYEGLRSRYEVLRPKHDPFPPFEEIRQLSVKEATLVFHWDAPAAVLGAPPLVQPCHELVVGSSEGSAVEYVKVLEELIKQQYEDESPAVLRPLSSDERVVSIYLDASEFIDWQALAFDGVRYRLLVDSQLVIG